MMKRILSSALLALILVLISGCGGGGGGGGGNDVITEPENPNVLTGIAAAGLPIVGNATLKDANGTEVSIPINPDGSFSIDTASLDAPFILFAEGHVNGRTVRYFSATESSSTINITPVTDFILRNAMGVDPQTAYDNWPTPSVTQSQLDAVETEVQAQLQPLLDAMGVAADVNLLTTPFPTDHTGLDAVLDSLQIIYSGNIATITNLLTGSSYTDDISQTGDGAGLPAADTAAVQSVLSDQAEINAFWQAATDFYSIPRDATTITNWINSHVAPEFLSRGIDRATMISDAVNEGIDVGAMFTGIIVAPMDESELSGYSKGYYFLMSDYNGRGEYIDRIVYDGTNWWWFGDGVWIDIALFSVAYETHSETGVVESITTLGLDFEDDSDYALNQGVNSIVVNGPGLPDNLLFSRTIDHPAYKMYQGPFQGTNDYIFTNDGDIAAIPDNAEYVLSLCAETPEQIVMGDPCTALTTYTEVEMKPPVLVSQLDNGIFPVLTSHSSHNNSAFNFGGLITIEWTLPAGAPDVTEATLDWFDGINNYEFDYYEANDGNETKQAVFDTTGLSPPVFTGILTLTAFDLYGREYKMSWEISPSGSDTDNGGGGGGGGSTPIDLVGVWLDDCTIDTGSGSDIARQFYISFNQDGTFEQEIREVDGLVCGRAANTSTYIGTYTLGADVVLTSGETAKQIERIITAQINNGVTTPLSQPLMLRGLVYVDGDTSWWNFSLQNDTAYPTDINLNASIIFYRQP